MFSECFNANSGNVLVSDPHEGRDAYGVLQISQNKLWVTGGFMYGIGDTVTSTVYITITANDTSINKLTASTDPGPSLSTLYEGKGLSRHCMVQWYNCIFGWIFKWRRFSNPQIRYILLQRWRYMGQRPIYEL
jgi:hypothetical protein